MFSLTGFIRNLLVLNVALCRDKPPWTQLPPKCVNSALCWQPDTGSTFTCPSWWLYDAGQKQGKVPCLQCSALQSILWQDEQFRVAYHRIQTVTMFSTLPPEHLYITTHLPECICNFTDSKGQNFSCIYFNAIHILLKPFRNHLFVPGCPTGLASKGMLARELLCIPCVKDNGSKSSTEEKKMLNKAISKYF